jgi:hypothetical protein
MPLWFSGATGDYAQVGDLGCFQPAGSYTFYVRYRPLVAVCALLSKWQGGFDASFLLEAASGTMRINMLGTDNNGYGADALKPMVIGKWQGTAGIKDADAGALRCWNDGYMGTDTACGVNMKDSSIPVTIGNRGDTPRPLKGEISWIATWDAALTRVELQAIDAGMSPFQVRKAQLSSFWRLHPPDMTDLLGNGAITRAGNVVMSEGVVSQRISIPVGGEIGLVADSATVYLDLQPSTAAEEAALGDEATVYLDLQPSFVEDYTRFDSATVYVDISALGGECYTRFHFTGEGEADLRWASSSVLCRWDIDDVLRWSVVIEVQPGC